MNMIQVAGYIKSLTATDIMLDMNEMTKTTQSKYMKEQSTAKLP